MNDLDNLYASWTQATGNLKWGVQKVFRDVFEAAKDGQTTLVYGADYRDGGACLVNTVGVMLTTGGGRGVPMAHFSEVVSIFDSLNSELESVGVNKHHGIVSPLAADIFLMHFAPERDEIPEVTDDTEPLADTTPYRETSDEDMAKYLSQMFISTSAPLEVNIQKDFKESAVHRLSTE